MGDKGEKEQRVPRWYFGGLAAAGAVFVTHPLDLLKVHLQTQQDTKTSLAKVAVDVVKKDGFFSLYTGTTASIFRQLTYSTVRFGIYEMMKQSDYFADRKPTFWETVVMAGVAGLIGGVTGTPGDLINVRMQNDLKLPEDKKRKYKNVFDGLFRVYKEEGVPRLFSGATIASTRAAVMTIGQLAFYDLFKGLLLKSDHFENNLTTHFAASSLAGTVATALTQPLDVVKTRKMNAKPGEYKGYMDIVLHTAKLGPLGFFKGFVPAFIRVAPHTIILFILMEQMTKYFGIVKKQQ